LVDMAGAVIFDDGAVTGCSGRVGAVGVGHPDVVAGERDRIGPELFAGAVARTEM
jgi:hypothetical protein